MDLSNLLSDFKQDIINDITTQLDSMQERRKNEELDAMLFEFCSHCGERKMNCYCKMVASIDINSISIKYHAIEEDNGEIFYVTQRRTWAQR